MPLRKTHRRSFRKINDSSTKGGGWVRGGYPYVYIYPLTDFLSNFKEAKMAIWINRKKVKRGRDAKGRFTKQPQAEKKEQASELQREIDALRLEDRLKIGG
jgi:hypothetical protein